MSAISPAARPRFALENRARWRRLMLALTAVALGVAIALRQWMPASSPPFAQLPSPPNFSVTALAGLGDKQAGGWLTLLWLQGFDSQSAGEMTLKSLDYDRLAQWLLRIDEALPRSDYPIRLAVMIYGAVTDPARQRKMLKLARALFAHHPENRWYWMALGASMAWHRLEDFPLAEKMADDLYRLAPPTAPAWASLMKIYLLRFRNEVDMTAFMIRDALRSGRIRDERTQRELLQFLERLEKQRQERVRPQYYERKTTP